MALRSELLTPTPRALGSIVLEIQAVNCWLSCQHCYAGNFSVTKKQMSLEDVFSCISFFKEISKEPLTVYLYKDLLDYGEKFSFIEELSRLGLKGAIELLPTHGWARGDGSKETAYRLAHSGVKKVWLTLHGNQNEHDYFVRRPGAYQRIFDFAQSAINTGVGVSWNLMLRKSNQLSLKSLLSNDDVLSLSQELYVSVPGGLGNGRSIIHDIPEIETVRQFQNLGIMTSTDIFSEAEWEFRIKSLNRLSTKCAMEPYAEIRIMPDLSIMLHDFPHDRVIGNISTDTPKTILERIYSANSFVGQLNRREPTQELLDLCEEQSKGGKDAYCIYGVVSRWIDRRTFHECCLEANPIPVLEKT